MSGFANKVGLALCVLTPLAVSCGNSSSSGGDAGAPGQGAAGDGIQATIGGTPFSFTQVLANGPVLSGRKFIGQAPSNLPRPPSFQITIPATKPGTYDCKTAPSAAVMYQLPKPDKTNTEVYVADDSHGSCSVTVTKVATDDGGRLTGAYEGSFEATLTRSGGTETAQVTAGSFRFTLK